MNIVCLIIDLFDVEPPIFQDPAVQFIQGILEPLHHNKHIGTGFTDCIHDNSGDTFVPNNNLDVLITQGNTGNVSYGDGDIVYPLDDYFGHVFRGLVLTHRAGNIPAFALIKVPGTDVSVFNVQGLHEFRDGDISGSQRVRVHDHL